MKRRRKARQSVFEMKCFITGASGFIGGHLVEYLLNKGHSVVGFDCCESPGAKRAGYEFSRGSILDGAAIADALAGANPDVVYHLAAQSFPGKSWEEPAQTYQINAVGSLKLLEALRQLELEAGTVMVCSSAEYDPALGGEPIREDDRLCPASPYGVSKLAEDHLARMYFGSYGLRTICARPFFLIGPGKQGDVCSDFARGIVAIERGEKDTLSVGNLDVVRDFLDIGDGVAALATLAEKGEPGQAYNICSGRGCSLQEILAIYKDIAEVPVSETTDSSLVRRVDEMARIGSPEKLKSLGWLPETELRESLVRIIDYWRQMGPES